MISDDKVIVQTTDFFPPMVNDPYLFGRISACNALSDLYAMGATPITALNLVAFPHEKYPTEVLKSILNGGRDVLKEAKCSLLGGHSITDSGIKYGLAVTGEAKLGETADNSHANVGDILVLTKPLGSGIAMNVAKAETDFWNSKSTVEKALKWMGTLNKEAGEAIRKFGIKTATDITGFSLIGHLSEIARASKVDVLLYKDSIPVMGDVLRLLKVGFYPAASHKNKRIYSKFVKTEFDLPIIDLLFDAQTSGGMLLSIPKDKLKAVLDFFDENLDYPVAIIGEIKDRKNEGAEIIVM
jgi:selenide,water dikinase